jgi:excisionase family DNA binding protein
MTIAELAEALRVSRFGVTQLLNSGALPEVRVGKRRLVRVEDYEQFLADGGAA